MLLTRVQKDELFCKHQEMIKAYTLKCMGELCIKTDMFDECFQEACVVYLEQIERSETDEWFDHLDYLNLKHRLCLVQYSKKRLSLGRRTDHYADRIREVPHVYTLDVETDKIIEYDAPLCKQALDNVELSAIVDDVFEHLSDAEKKVVHMRLEGESMGVIAGALGVCPATVTNILARLNKKIFFEEE